MMRRIFVALLVGAVAVGLAAPASAADLKFFGAYRFRFQVDDAMPCLADDAKAAAAPAPAVAECSGSDFQSRFRPRFEVETEGGVKGVIYLEIGDIRFGRGAVGGGHGADGINVETKWAYIDFPVPATPLRLRAGIQPFFVSKALFFDDDASGLSLYGKLGEANANFWWTRLNRAGASTGSFASQITSGASGIGGGVAGVDVGTDGQFARDVYGIDLSLSPMKDLMANVYLVYDHDNETIVAGQNTTGVWFGAAVAGKVQSARWDLDFVYGNKETPHPASGLKVDQKGFVVDGGIGMPLAGTPFDLEGRFWWATGWDGTATGDIDAFPVLYGGSGGHEPGTQVWGGGGVVDINALADNPQNTWGIGLIARYTASPTLKLTGNVHYIGTQEEGTAARPSPVGEGFLYGVDSVGTEVGVRADYTIAKGLIFTLTAGVLFIADDTPINSPGVTRFDDVTKVSGVLNYGF